MYDPTQPFKEAILQANESTWHTPHTKVTKNIYPIYSSKITLPQVQHTDGIGTKGAYHWRKKTLKNAVTDALAMNLNDLALVGATPYLLQNHLVLPRDDHNTIITIVKEIAQQCRARSIVMTGGETSIHKSKDNFDISITVTGFVEHAFKNQMKPGDILIGFKSSGIHSNGITKLREVYKNRILPEFTVPTKIYLEDMLEILKDYNVHAMMHITGGAFGKLKDVLSGNDVIIDHTRKLKPHKIFFDLHRKGVNDKTLYSTFNCGVGFMLSAPSVDAESIVQEYRDAFILGKIIKGNGSVVIHSAFSKNIIKL